MSGYPINEGLEYKAAHDGAGVVLTRKADGATCFFQGEEAVFAEGEFTGIDPLQFDQLASEYDLSMGVDR